VNTDKLPLSAPHIGQGPPLDLDSKPISTLFSQYAIPMTIGMLLNSLYQLVDAIFIGRYLGFQAMSGISLALPWQLLLIAIATMISNGNNTLLSRCLGAKDILAARKITADGFTLLIFISILFYGYSFAGLDSNALPDDISAGSRQHALEYLTPLCRYSGGLFLLCFYSDVLRSLNRMKPLFLVIVVGALGNIVADFVALEFFNSGLAGVAWATIISQLCSVLIAINSLKGSGFQWPELGQRVRTMTSILMTGAPSFLSFISVGVLMAFVNSLLIKFGADDGDTLVGIYGVLSRISIFIVLPLIAISNACQTICAYSFGAGHIARTICCVTLALKVSILYLSYVMLVMLVFPSVILRLFEVPPELMTPSVDIIKIMYSGIPLAGISGVCIAVSQALNYKVLAVVMSLFKVYLLLIPLLWFTSSSYSIDRIWISFPVADIGMAMVSVAVLMFLKKQMS